MEPLSFLGLIAWMALMTCGVVYISLDTLKTGKRRKQIKQDPPLLRAVLMAFGVSAEESIACQTLCIAGRKEILDELKNLVSFHRPCLQYPLSEHWWQLDECNYGQGRLSAVLQFQDRYRLPIKVKLVWSLREKVVSTGYDKLFTNGEIEVLLEWYRMDAFESSYKHNILLSMAAYTDEHLKKLNNATLNASAKSKQNFSQSPPLLGAIAPAGSMVEPVESVSWPTAQDYNEAVQNPKICFVDADLREGEAELNMLGVPRAISGAFATVYRISTPERDYAVRCFLNPVRDQHLRYSILTKHLAIETTSAIVNFNFIQDGMKVLGKAFPVLKMEWADGLPFTSFIEKNISQPDTIAKLRTEFCKMVCDLRRAKIAHGDLQHGNILVKENEGNLQLILVDYDGMFVPELVRFHSAELGHSNYQHPRRAGKHFGLFLDNFAGWLIDTSLVCLEEDPSLWNQFDGGDECILFRKRDMQKPDESRIFKLLEKHRSDRIKESVQHFFSLLQMELEEIPFLELQ